MITAHVAIRRLHGLIEESVVDPRIDRGRWHELEDILIISILAIIAGADTLAEIEEFGCAWQDWLEEHLALPNGIPSTSTFQRVLRAVDPEEFEAAFDSWLASLFEPAEGEVVAVDGKTMRRSHDRANHLSALHVVSAWASDHRLVIGQRPCAEKSNEITAIPELLDHLQIEGCVVTTDAMGCQKAIASKILERGADYFLQVKKNQPSLMAQLEAHFSDERCIELGCAATEDAGHGRLEERRAWVSFDVDEIPACAEWPEARSVILIEAERVVDGESSISYRLYLSSLGELTSERANEIARTHWGVENELHWVLDVVFREDEGRQRLDHAARNFARLRKWALNMLRLEPSKKSLQRKRKRAGWDRNFMMTILRYAMGLK